MFSSHILLWLIFNIICVINVTFASQDIWAVLVAGPTEIYSSNYAMEASAYKMYNLLIERGVNKDHIILISSETSSYHPQNVNPGSVTFAANDMINIEHMSNYYENIVIDYNSEKMNTQLFYDILKGNSTLAAKVGSGKVLKSGPHDKVLIYFVTFGFYGYLKIGKNSYLYAENFVPCIENLNKEKRFGKMYIIVDSDKSGSMFDNYLETSPDTNIIVQSLGGRYNDLNFCHYSKKLNAYTSSCNSYLYFRYLDNLLLQKQTANLLHLNSHLNDVNYAPVIQYQNLYGNLLLGLEKLSTFFGERAHIKNLSNVKQKNSNDENESISHVLKEGKSIRQLILEDSSLIDIKVRFDNVMSKIISTCANKIDIKKSFDEIPLNEHQCLEQSLHFIRNNCFTEQAEYFPLLQGEKIIELCNLNIPQSEIQTVIRDTCKINNNLF